MIIVIITSQNKSDSLQIEIGEVDVSTILPKESFVRCHRIASIESKLIIGIISKANDNLLKVVEEKIKLLTTEITNPVAEEQIAE